MTTKNSLIEAEQFVEDFKSKGPEGIPIYLVGTKNDKNPLEVTSKDLSDLASKLGDPVCFLGETSSKTKSFVFGAFDKIRNNLEEKEIKKTPVEPILIKNESINDISSKSRKSIQQQLEDYTSFGNKFSAWAKWFFSFGQFSLGFEKQKLADEIIIELAKGASVDFQSYEARNKRLVINEYNSSSRFFKSRYASKINESEVLNVNEGELGEILKTAPKIK